ncbi:hypothetical protein DICSQDRAFT_179128 [Dichomitus squalens LYAD-421 SS1]|uniref:uncharacterized protein n=1 Tax=Dichomitus squalens (strain LYAD-421) TaxID=732165 RepID=UPI0004416089|nr:uncharacterized protein DICSQDRAFT_179128 [Dichomitus squalens LYAD-421 SS1]EJF63894.1 hypothetical protein DICSQDRAFT_179128 [Dichomitus squalens LYAD-421 SS1]
MSPNLRRALPDPAASQMHKPTREVEPPMTPPQSARAEEAERQDEIARRHQRPDMAVRIAKQSSSASRAAAARMASSEEIVGERHRQSLRKTAHVPSNTAAGKRPQSSFPYIAPLLQVSSRPMKSVPIPPPHLAAQEEREKRSRQEEGDYSLGSRSAPRKSLASMSVQRRVGQSPRKAPVGGPVAGVRAVGGDAFPDARVHVGRRGKLVYGSSESESEKEVVSLSEDEDEVSVPARPALGRKTVFIARRGINAARKTNPLRKLTKAARKLDLDDSPGTALAAGKRARKRDVLELLSDESDDNREDVIELTDSSSSSDIHELLDVFAALTLTTSRLQQYRKLPFLLRNLRMGFESRCRTFRIPIGPEEFPKHPVEVIYRYAIQESESDDSDVVIVEPKYQEFVGILTEWACPMCGLHKPFRNRAMLVYHLEKDHAETKVTWDELKGQEEKGWKLSLFLPDVDELEDDTSEGNEEGSEDEREDVPVEDDVGFPRHTSDSKRVKNSEPLPMPALLFLPESDDEGSTSVTPLPLSTEPESEDIKPTPTTPIKRRISLKPMTGRPSLATAPRRSYRGSLPARYPSPPPPDDPQGPAAQYPYLPQTTADGQEEVYSCRVGGPRIFDLLNTLPTDEKFGIMAWEIVHREEELFEMEDVRDEDKVMLALWNRYIIMNRQDFTKNDYYDGLIKFINKYWETIHQAAGWRALRAFLIMLCLNRYLKFEDILKVLEHYEEKTGMDLWYKDTPSGGGT